jgi:hypothetical protein
MGQQSLSYLMTFEQCDALFFYENLFWYHRTQILNFLPLTREEKQRNLMEIWQINKKESILIRKIIQILN